MTDDTETPPQDPEAAAIAAELERVTPSQRRILKRAWTATTAKPLLLTMASSMKTAQGMISRGWLKLTPKEDGFVLTAEGNSLGMALKMQGWPGCEDPPPPAAKVPAHPLDALAADLDAAAAAPGGSAPDDSPRPAARPKDDRADRGGDGGSGARPPKEPRPKGEIWKGCPVQALGQHGDTSYFLDVLGQLRGVTKLDRQKIMNLFGHEYEALCWHFPQWTAPRSEDEAPKRKDRRFEGDAAAATMSEAVSERGVIDPTRIVRGVGAWADDEGGLIYHVGDQVIIGGKERKPARIADYIYPAAPPIPHPAKKADPKEDVIQMLQDTFATWRWARPDLDKLVMTAMVGCQMMGGAFGWRPQFWLTGPKSSGKSDLQKLLEHLQGGEYGVIKAEDATPASIANALRISTLPVSLDELEATDTGSKKEMGIVEIMRIASSGGHRTRSDPQQGMTRMVLRSTFVASSIIIPGVLSPQDRSRLVILDLSPFKGGEAKPDLSPKPWRARGAQVKRMLIERWPSWAKRLDLWRAAFQEHRVASRDEDNWATIMAMVDMMESAELPDEAKLSGRTELVMSHIKGNLDHGSDAEAVLVHLLGQIYDPFRRGAQYTIGQWLMVAGDLDNAPAGLRASLVGNTTDQHKSDRQIAAEAANNMLAPLLIRVARDRSGGQPVMFVGNSKVVPLQQLFRDTIWHGGAWSQSLARIPGAYTKSGDKYVSRRFSGLSTKGVEVPFASIPGLAAFPADHVVHTPIASQDDMEEYA